MDLKQKILKAINIGLNESLLYIEDLDDEDDFSLSKKSISQAIKDSNSLLNILKDPMHISKTYIDMAKKLHASNNFLYNPHLDGEDFKFFIQKCIDIEGDDADLNWIDTSSVTDMSKLFGNEEEKGVFNKSNFTGNISDWKVFNVINMNCMFIGCHKFNNDISSWDVSNVTNMEYMFYGCHRFNLNISSWNISKVNNFYYFLAEASDFNQNLSSWNILKIKGKYERAGMLMNTKIEHDGYKWPKGY